MANINVSYEDMTAAAQRLSNGMTQIDDLLSQLKGEMDQLVNGGFVTYQASKAFQGEGDSRCDRESR